MILYFKDKLRGKPAFSKGELSLILGLYGTRVQKGEWRDYAIDYLHDMAVFSIYKSSKEAPIYSIAKLAAQGFLKPARFVVLSGEKTIKESTTLADILGYFEEKA